MSNASVLTCFLKITQVGRNLLREWVTNLFGFVEGTSKMDKIFQFLDYNKLPLVTKLTELNSARVYSSPVQLQVANISFTILSLFLDFFFSILYVFPPFPFKFNTMRLIIVILKRLWVMYGGGKTCMYCASNLHKSTVMKRYCRPHT